MSGVNMPIERLELGARVLAYKAIALRKEVIGAHARGKMHYKKMREKYGSNFNAMKKDPDENVRVRDEQVMNDSHIAFWEVEKELKDRFDVSVNLIDQNGRELICFAVSNLRIQTCALEALKNHFDPINLDTYSCLLKEIAAICETTGFDDDFRDTISEAIAHIGLRNELADLTKVYGLSESMLEKVRRICNDHSTTLFVRRIRLDYSATQRVPTIFDFPKD